MGILSGCQAHSKTAVNSSATTTPKKEDKKDPRSYFDIDKDGKVKTKSGKAEKTFSFPDIKVGFIFIAPQMDILPVLSLEIYEFKKVPFYFDFGISPHVAYLSVGYNVISIFEVGIFAWAGYHFLDRDEEFWGQKFYGMSFGLGITVLKF